LGAQCTNKGRRKDSGGQKKRTFGPSKRKAKIERQVKVPFPAGRKRRLAEGRTSQKRGFLKPSKRAFLKKREGNFPVVAR